MNKPNPLVKVVVVLAGVAAGIIGNKIITGAWGAVFGEDAPTSAHVKQSAKDTKAARKQAKKDGASKDEVKAIIDPENERPVWQVLLWTLLSGVVLQGLRHLAQGGAQASAQRISARRPRANRG